MATSVMIIPGHGGTGPDGPDTGHTAAGGAITEHDEAVRFGELVRVALDRRDVIWFVVEGGSYEHESPRDRAVGYIPSEAPAAAIELHFAEPATMADPAIFYNTELGAGLADYLRAALLEAGAVNVNVEPMLDAPLSPFTDCATVTLVLAPLGSLDPIRSVTLADAIASACAVFVKGGDTLEPWPVDGPPFLVMTGVLTDDSPGSKDAEAFNSMDDALDYIRTMLSSGAPAGAFATLTLTQPMHAPLA